MEIEPAVPDPPPDDRASKPPLPPVDDPATIEILPASAVFDDPVDKVMVPASRQQRVRNQRVRHQRVQQHGH